jgi:hypothetical protein
MVESGDHNTGVQDENVYWMKKIEYAGIVV